MRRYMVAKGSTSNGELVISRMGLAKNCPITSKNTPLSSATLMTVWITSLISRLRPKPMKWPMTTLAPTDRPTNRLVSRLMAAVLLPTAPKACRPAKWPTTAISAELNNCCRILLAARGSAKSNILSSREPWSISISLRFFTGFTSCVIAPIPP